VLRGKEENGENRGGGSLAGKEDERRGRWEGTLAGKEEERGGKGEDLADDHAIQKEISFSKKAEILADKC